MLAEGKMYDEDMNREEVEDEEVKSEFNDSELTSLPGIGAATAEKLATAGFGSLMSIAVATPGELVGAVGISETVARKVINAARNSLDMGFFSGEDLLIKRENVIKIPTGSESFNQLMGGGFETGCITECFGQYGSSKTQIAHQLCVNIQKIDPTT